MINNNSKAFVVVTLALILVGAIGLGLLKVIGVPFAKTEREMVSAPEAPAEVVSQFKQSPAWVSLNDALSSPPKGWEGKGEILDSPQAPYPLSCAPGEINPVVSVARLFSVGGKQVQVVTTAYTAGLGVEGLRDRFEAIDSCDGGGAYTNALSGIGQETHQVNVSKSDSNTKDIVFRDGDIVTYVVTDPGNGAAYDQAKAFRDHLMSKVDKKCVALEVSETDPKRNPYSLFEFTGLLKDREVSIEEFPLPKDGKVVQLNDDGTKKPSDEQKEQEPTKVEKVYPLDPQPVNVPDVERPVQPTEYPVWPLLPAEMEKPSEPQSPGAQPVVKKTIQEQIDDPKGPGCGWDFTGSVAPEFNAAEAKVEFSQKETAAKSELRKDAQQWQKDVLVYWSDYHKFRKDLAKWNDYSEDVNEVSAAWEKIRQQWATYYANKEIYDAAVTARENFIQEKERVRRAYPLQLEQCRVQAEQDARRAEQERREAAAAREAARNRQPSRDDEDDTRRSTPSESTNSPSSESTPNPEPSTSGTASESDENEVSPQNTETVRFACPVQRPAILDQDPPSVPEAPTPPADPRPANKRD